MNEIIDKYQLTSMQKGMLFEHIYDPHSGINIEQIIVDLPEKIEVSQFKDAWKKIIARHATLRTSFEWEGLDDPLQLVYERGNLKFSYEDWRHLSDEVRNKEFEDYLLKDRVEGFKLAKPSSMRITLFMYKGEFYRCLWTYHHILMDGRAVPIILKELFTIYEASKLGKEIDLLAPPPYCDYIDWLQKQDFTGEKDYWQRLLKGYAPPTHYGIDYHQSKKNLSSALHGTQTYIISESMTSALKRFADENQITLNTIVQGVWAIMLSIYTSKDEVVFGVIKTNRYSTGNQVPTQSMVGLLINTLPMRVPISPQKSLTVWLKEIRSQWTALRKYEHSSLMDIQGWSDVYPGKPLFESMVGFEYRAVEKVLRDYGGLWSSRRVTILEKPNFPLFFMANADKELHLKISYDQERFDRDSIFKMLEHINVLFRAFLKDPGGNLSSFQLLTEKEQDQILLEWNDTANDSIREKFVHQVFEDQVGANPDQIAVTYLDQNLTYQELNSRSNQVAHLLIQKGVEPEVCVGLSMDQSLELLVGILGILKAGGVYVPIDPATPIERLRFLVKDAGVKILLTNDQFKDQFRTTSIEIINIESDIDFLSNENTHNPHQVLNPENLVYILYTSGSTGKPKGVAVQHNSLANNLLHTNEEIFNNQNVIIPLLFNITFDPSMRHLLDPLLRGGTVFLLPDKVRSNPQALFQYLKACEHAGIHCVPSYWKMILDDLEAGHLKEPDNIISNLLIGGEKVEEEVITRTRKLLPTIQIWNMYGPTETTISSTQGRVDSGSGVSIGKPISNTQIYVLGRNLQPVPVNVPGMLYVGGIGLARCYLNNPGLTASKFIPNPFGDKSGSRLYNTGDMVRWTVDGNLEFVGRVDQQVKIRGYRIELGEIEAIINRYPGVKDSVVADHQTNHKSQRLIAYIVLEKGANPAFDELRSHIQRYLPEYMVPSNYIYLDLLPLTPNGKVDRNALPIPDNLHGDLDNSFVSPRTATEQKLTDIWSDILKVQRIGVHDNFFELGGDSLSATRVISRISSIFGVSIPIKEIFNKSTITDIAARIDDINELS